MALPGKSAVTVFFQSPFDLWKNLAGDRAAYLAEKEKILADTTKWLERAVPGITEDIEVTDVATPLTTIRYTGNYHGSYEGWRPTVKTMQKNLARKLPGLENFTMIGQWTAGFSGLPSVAADGRLVIEKMCMADGKAFTTSV
jgi:phytoene dehydrogenase-like protein